jgi:hypothetical protein
MSDATAARPFPSWPATPTAVGVTPEAPHLAAAFRAGDHASRTEAAQVTTRRPARLFGPR